MIRAAAKNHAHVGVVVDPAQYGPVLDELRTAGALSARDPARAWPRRRSPAPRPTTRPSPPGWPARTTPRRTAEPLPASLDLRWSGPRSCATARTRTSRPPATAGRGAELVGRRRPARRQGAVLPEPLRHRGGVAAGAALRRAGRGDRQARQPVRGRRGGRHHHAPTWPPTRATRSRPSGASWPPTGRCRWPWPRRWRRCSPRWWWRRRSTTTALERPGGEEEPPGALGAAAADGRGSTCGASTAGCWCKQVDRVALDRAAWRVVTDGAAGRGPLGRAGVRLAGVRRGQLERHRAHARTARPSGSAPASRTGSTRPASRSTKAAGRADGGSCASDAFFPFRDGLDAVAAAGVAGRDPARRQRARRRGDRRRRRARPRHGLHRRAPLPALIAGAAMAGSYSLRSAMRQAALRCARSPTRRWPCAGGHGAAGRLACPMARIADLLAAGRTFSFEFFPPEDRCGPAEPGADHRRAGAARAQLRVGDLRRRREHPPAHPRGRHLGPAGDRHHADGPPHLRGPSPGRDRPDPRVLPGRGDREHPGPRRRPARGTRPSSARATTAYAAELVEPTCALPGRSASAWPPTPSCTPARPSRDERPPAPGGQAGRGRLRHHPVLLRRATTTCAWSTSWLRSG